jgi:hypothetical protein
MAEARSPQPTAFDCKDQERNQAPGTGKFCAAEAPGKFTARRINP